MYDIIGDVHGHASVLKRLLLKLGYQKTNGAFFHSSRKAVFTGDFINRGPEIRKTIRIIKAMVERGSAYAILGNHEINAIIYHLKDKNGNLLVNKPSKYFLSLFKTINEYSPTSMEWQEHLKWMRTLPLYLDFKDLRVVHACWSDEAVNIADTIYDEGKIRKRTFRNIHKKPDSDIAKAVWLLTKGVNLKMPGDLKVVNNKGISQRAIRLRWWENLENKTFKHLSFESKCSLPDYTVPCQILPQSYPYPENSPILFFGHYCRGRGPYIIKHNICCVDSCVTGTGRLTAYRWQGEKELETSNLVHSE